MSDPADGRGRGRGGEPDDGPAGTTSIVPGIRRVPPPGPLPASEPRLVERLQAEIAASGPITFARFMAVALHDPELGYYAAPGPRPGRAGDFVTAPELHPIFGWTIARTVEEAWGLAGRPAPFTLVEHGAGSGTLGVAILDGLRRSGSPLLAALRYEPVETAPPRRAELEGAIAAAGFAGSLAAPDAAPVAGVVLANELLDALPFHRVTSAAGRLRELLVDWDGAAGRFVDAVADPTTPALAARLEAEGIELADGQRAEICLELDPWLASVAGRLERGVVLLVDYGHDAAELYGPARREGTLRTYLRQMVGRDPYAHVGRQDVTAHVDLTAVVRAGEAAGLRHLGTTTQAAFLVGSGLGELLAAIREDPATTLPSWIELRAAVARLLDPGATGGFRVVAFGRALPGDATLAGLGRTRPDLATAP
ncbi:MAG: hypothetical protein RL338_734 [Chloroflexota bacterium]